MRRRPSDVQGWAQQRARPAGTARREEGADSGRAAQREREPGDRGTDSAAFDRRDLVEVRGDIEGLRALGANVGGAPEGVFTDRPGVLSNDFFTHLLDNDLEWRVSQTAEHVYEGRSRTSGEQRWTASAVDLVFGSNSQLRAVAEVYGSSDSPERFVRDFVAAWDKVMMLDRFDLRR